MKLPKVIFLDAVGTLFGVWGGVGQVYSHVARQFGVEVPADRLNQAFKASFSSATPMAFPGVAAESIPAQEFAWWQIIATQTFAQAGVLNHFSDFSAFFGELYHHFETAAPWFVYDDVRQTLAYWQAQGVELGVISNFDSRLLKVLPALNLAEFFQSVTISTTVGAAKPDPQIFTAALQKHNLLAKDAWHIGDSFNQDYQAAKAAGLKGIWLKR
ncbi:MAG: HAD family hydrolase [Cyanothece sp. SIO1E1]|nr:HAD family hydrolase [Cyanothece sp. SIO1E1]